MPLKRFVGATATEALSLARREAGKDALIVASRTLSGSGGAGSRGAGRYEVLVAHEAAAIAVVAPPPVDAGSLSTEVARVHRMLRSRGPGPSSVSPATGPADDAVSEALYRELRGCGLSASMTALLVSRVRSRLTPEESDDAGFVRSLLVAALADLLASEAPEVPSGTGRRRMVVVGPPGTGKTTAIAKLAFHYALRRRRSVSVVSVDREKAGASARIQTLAAAAGIPFRAASTREEIAAVLAETGEAEITLVDTAGSGATFGDPLGCLGPLSSIPGDCEFYLVLSGAMASTLTRRVVDLYRVVGLSGVILTMLDASLPLGETVESLLTAGIPVAFLCRGADVSDGVELATAHRVAALVLQSAKWDGNFSS